MSRDYFIGSCPTLAILLRFTDLRGIYGSRYRTMAKELAGDLEKYSQGIQLVVGSDKPSDFDEFSHILAFKLQQKGILPCYNDKRFVL